MPNVRFSGLTKHGRLAFNAGPVYGFEDPDAVPYFTTMGWAEATDDAADLTIPIGELDIDPFTLFGDGPSQADFVLPERAAAEAEALGLTAEQAIVIVRSGVDIRDLPASEGEA